MTPSFDRENAIFNMIEQQIRPWKVLNQNVLNVFYQIPRDHFTDKTISEISFSEARIPLQNNDKMLFPALEGRIMQELLLQPSDHVLHIGTGSGFLPTCIAKLTEKVVSIDINDTYTQDAIDKAKTLNVNNIEFLTQDLSDLKIEPNSIDAIVFTGSLLEVPSNFFEALKESGRLLAFIGKQNHPITSAILYEKICGQIRTSSLFEVELERLHGFEDQPSFVF